MWPGRIWFIWIQLLLSAIFELGIELFSGWVALDSCASIENIMFLLNLVAYDTSYEFGTSLKSLIISVVSMPLPDLVSVELPNCKRPFAFGRI